MQWAKQKQNGFTIVELLIVVVVIAILAAITIVSYMGIQNSTHDSAVKSDLSTLAKKIEMVRASGSGYPVPFTASMGLGVSKSSYAPARNNLYYCVSPDSDRFVIGAISNSGNGFLYISDQGIQGPTTITGAIVCQRAGQSAWSSGYTYTQLGFNYDQSGTKGWATWLE